MACMAVKPSGAKAVQLAFHDFQIGYVGVVTTFKSTSKRWSCDCGTKDFISAALMKIWKF